MHYLDPDSFEAEGPEVSAEDVTELGHAFIPNLLNRCLFTSPWSAFTYYYDIATIDIFL